MKGRGTIVRIRSIKVTNSLPVRLFEIDELSDVVVLAGPNGVGKTRLLASIMMLLRGDRQPDSSAVVEATCSDEREAWGKKILDLTVEEDLVHYRQTLHSNRRRRNWKSSILQFESNRAIANVQPYQFTWDIQDPADEEVSWDYGFQYWRDRWQDTLHSMFRTIEAQKQSIATRAVQLRREGRGEMKLNFTDPMQPFKDVFAQLLAPKQLVDPAARKQTLEYIVGDEVFDISTLSSGEREVINIAFDFLLRRPSDSMVFFDEPELHLHPELSHRLVQTLQTIGARNQFILSTHSPDVITAALDQSVIFVSPPRQSEDGFFENQAIPVAETDETNQALKMVGQSIGIVSLGKKIVLVEGDSSSLDKDVYGAITRTRFPDLVLVPSGGKHALESFDLINDVVLSRTIWGVDFFMLCDRDSIPAGTPQGIAASGRFASLEKYHLENYFLDAAVISDAFSDLEQPGHWLRDAAAVRDQLRDLARPIISYAVALHVSAEVRRAAGNVSIMPKDCHGLDAAAIAEKLVQQAEVEESRVGRVLDTNEISRSASATYEALTSSLDSDSDFWLAEIPGKPLLRAIAAKAELKVGRFKTIYLRSALAIDNAGPFSEIVGIFKRFDVG